MKKTRLLSPALILCAAGPWSPARATSRSTSGTRTPSAPQLSDYAATWDGYAEAYTSLPTDPITSA